MEYTIKKYNIETRINMDVKKLETKQLSYCHVQTLGISISSGMSSHEIMKSIFIVFIELSNEP